MTKELKQHCWWDDEDPDNIIYFRIWDGDVRVWESSWNDARDLTPNSRDLANLRSELLAKLVEHGMDTSKVETGHWCDWT